MKTFETNHSNFILQKIWQKKKNTVFAHLPQRLLTVRCPDMENHRRFATTAHPTRTLSKDTKDTSTKLVPGERVKYDDSVGKLPCFTIFINIKWLQMTSNHNEYHEISNYFKLQKVHELFQAPGCFVIPEFHVPTSSTSLQYRLLGCCHSPQISYWRHLKYGASIATATWRDL